MNSQPYENVNRQEMDIKKITPIYQNKVLCLDTDPSIADILFSEKPQLFSSVLGEEKKTIWEHTKECMHSAVLEGKYDLESFDQILVVLDPYSKKTIQEYIALLQFLEKEAPNVVINLIEIRNEYDKNHKKPMSFPQEQTKLLFECEKYKSNHIIIWTNSTHKYEDTWIEALQRLICKIARQQTDQKRAQLKQRIEDTQQLLGTRVTGEIQRNAIETIASCLKEAISEDNSYYRFNVTAYFEEHQKDLSNALKILQKTKASYFNSMVNLIATTFLLLSVVGLPLLWITGVLKNNYEKTGHALMFMASGDKQRAQVLIHEIESNIQRKSRK
ncbi:MAG TPA: hypothetical protein VHD33_01610 [Legionellaceae bacterium]|nr:hypothetical protein [Legionellaceae bacterium]